MVAPTPDRVAGPRGSGGQLAVGAVHSDVTIEPCRRTLLLAVVMTTTLLLVGGCRRSDEQLTEWQRIKSGALDVVLLSPQGSPRHGRDTLAIEFRSSGNGQLVDVGDVRATATMPMAGMPMIGSIDVTRANVAGRYTAVAQLEMAGTWRIELHWQGASGSGSVTFPGTVQ